MDMIRILKTDFNEMLKKIKIKHSIFSSKEVKMGLGDNSRGDCIQIDTKDSESWRKKHRTRHNFT